jgi:putative ABC transport system ATP-binding protein
MITLKNITISRSGQILIENASLHVNCGEKIAICGKSGCGKSSLLAAIAGCFPLESGTITVNGCELTCKNISQIRSSIAFIGQEPVTGADTVRAALLLPFTFKVNRRHLPDESAIISKLEQLHLKPEILDKACSTISGGEKQRIAIARALLMNKQIFLADEVTSALDPASREAVLENFSAPDLTVISISHDKEWLKKQDFVYELSHKNFVLKQGGDSGSN